MSATGRRLPVLAPRAAAPAIRKNRRDVVFLPARTATGPIAGGLAMKLPVITILALAPLTAWAGDPIPGVDVSLEQIPGPVFKSEDDCSRIPGAVVVVRNGVKWCQAPASAISHNSSRSNFSRQQGGGAGGTPKTGASK
ncbi:MAG: hypothetical protein D6811_01945 [Alphaproteobacteria bacterium]|nr:MAG: hypothetical protein D6811_01945 [Alphaproteobacteria bacterium]